MADEKVIELLSQFYSEFKEFKIETNKRFDGIDQRFESIDQRFDGIDQKFESIDQRFDRIESHLLRIENENGAKLDALFDGYKQLSESQEIIKKDIIEIKEKLKSQEIEIKVIKGGKG